MTEIMNHHFADAAWDAGRIGVIAAGEDDPDQLIGEGKLEWVDPDDDSAKADDRRRRVITEALSALGWEPVPDAEWQHIEGGLGAEAGAERVPVQPIVGGS